jgi:hypothetical protein
LIVVASAHTDVINAAGLVSNSPRSAVKLSKTHIISIPVLAVAFMTVGACVMPVVLRWMWTTPA